MVLVPVMHWAKIRLTHQEGVDYEEGFGPSGAGYDSEYANRDQRTGRDRSWWGIGSSNTDDHDRWGRAVYIALIRCMMLCSVRIIVFVQSYDE
jgi:hypothetical protein